MIRSTTKHRFSWLEKEAIAASKQRPIVKLRAQAMLASLMASGSPWIMRGDLKA